MNRLFAWVAALACVAPFAARAAAVPYDLVELATHTRSSGTTPSSSARWPRAKS
jgi:hypothetical protein